MLPCSSSIGLTVSFTFSCDLAYLYKHFGSCLMLSVIFPSSVLFAGRTSLGALRSALLNLNSLVDLCLFVFVPPSQSVFPSSVDLLVPP